MDVRQLEYFVQIAKYRGFNRAAAHLNMVQSALSRQMRLLEEDLDVTLMIRHGRGIELTPAGERLLERAGELLQQFRRVRYELALDKDAIIGDITLGLPSSLQSQIGVPLLKQMRALHPGIFVHTRVAPSMEIKHQLMSGALQIAVLGTMDAEPGLEMHPLFHEEVVLMGAADAEFPDGAALTLDDITDYPLIMTSRPNSVKLLSKDGTIQQGPKCNVIMEVSSVPLILDLVSAHVGYTLVPISTIDLQRNRSDFSIKRVDNMVYEWFAAHLKDYALPPPAAAAKAVITDLGKSLSSTTWT